MFATDFTLIFVKSWFYVDYSGWTLDIPILIVLGSMDYMNRWDKRAICVGKIMI